MGIKKCSSVVIFYLCFFIDLEKIVKKHNKLEKHRCHVKILNLHLHYDFNDLIWHFFYDFELRINQIEHVLILIPYNTDKSAKHKGDQFPKRKSLNIKADN